MKERREKGLCYNCEEKFSPGHRCKTQKLYLLDGTQTEEEDGTEQEEAIEARQGEVSMSETVDFPEISLHVISGMVTPQTMRARGNLGRNSVMVLIDSGSTHNFIDQQMAKKAGMEAQQEKGLEVMVAN